MPRCLKPLARGFFLLGLLATPAMAQEELNGYPITDVNLRAGPGTEYPVLVTVPTDAPITILGCLEDYTWCDTIFEQHRGWMSSIYLAGYYDGEYYLLSDYAPDLGYQVLTFDRAAYWDAYYQDEPFYDDQSRVTEARGEDWLDHGVFYERLSPHGAWTWTQGQYVWVPTGVDAGWRPYTRGRWVTPTTAGRGPLMSLLVGRRITTDAGAFPTALAGFGCLATAGDRLGSLGGNRMITSPGRHCRRPTIVAA